jgi:gamma-glutamyltranspeptidase/glutathione hydrolase
MVLNNVQENFTRLDSISPGKPVNVMEPLKRRRTSMAPTLVFDRNGKRLRLAVGAAGGGAIPDHVTQTVLGVTTYKTDPQAAINHGHYSGQTITSNCAGVIGARSELERDTDHLSSTNPAHARARLGNIAIDLSARAGRWHRFVGS